MVREFEGKTEQEAIENAISALNIDRENIDVEIIDSGKKGFFKKGNVKIRIHIEDEDNSEEFEEQKNYTTEDFIESDDAFDEEIRDFLTTIIEKMGYSAEVQITFKKDGKLGLNIESPHSGIIIGKKGKNLDSLQLLVNVYAAKAKSISPLKVIVDSENYRIRHEEQIIRNAFKTAEQVRKSKRSRLLDPMNPFERRLVHTALNDITDIETRSEGEGLYKQVRIIYKGSAN